MSEAFQLILIIAAILAGALTVFFSNQLMQKYQLSYLNSYFYYLLFLNIFGVYSLVGSGVAIYFYQIYQGSEEISNAISLFLLILGTPFLILANYMLIRISYEISNRYLSGTFTLIYFLFALLLMGAFAYISIRVSRNNPEFYSTFKYWQTVAFSIFLLTIHLFGFIFILSNVKSRLDRMERKAIRIFGSFFMLFCGVSVLLLQLSEFAEILKFIFIFFFLSIHLLPILYHSLYLDKHYVANTATTDIETELQNFIQKYEISNRETDIIELICKGQTNQEISDSLFISLQTVKDHVHRIYTKTGIKNRVQLINLIRSSN